MATKPTILVTGATGTIGRELVAQLHAAGAQVLAGSRQGQARGGAPGRVVDFSNPASLQQAFAGVDVLFLLFPLAPNMLDLARNAIAAAKAAGVGHVVRSSGAGADPASAVPIARVQGEVDQLVRDSGLPYTLLQPNCFFQNWINFYGGMVKGGQVYLSHAQGKTSYVDVRDIAQAAATVVQNPQKHINATYVLTGAQALTVPDILAAIERHSARHASYVPVPEEQAVASMKGMGLDDWTAGMLSSLNQIIAAGYASGLSGDVEKLTDHAPRTVDDFARDHAAAWR